LRWPRSVHRFLTFPAPPFSDPMATELIERWLATSRLAKQSRSRRRVAFRAHLLPLVRELRASDLTSSRLLAIQGAFVAKEALSLRVARYVFYGCLAPALRDAARAGTIPFNPTPKLLWPGDRRLKTRPEPIGMWAGHITHRILDGRR